VKRLPAAILAATFALVLCFYLWTASGGSPFEWGRRHDGYYNLLTDSLLKGRLDLPVAPRPELFALVDPYDPAKNAPYRLHDVSLYHGRYYLYFGIAPALTVFAPLRLLRLGDLPEGLAAALFCFGGFAFAALLLRHLTRTFLPATPFWMQWLGVLALGLVNVAPVILRGPSTYDVYHVAIGAGYFFVFGGAYFLATAGPRLSRLALGGLFLGLAVASRPNHIFAAPLLLLALPALPAARRWRAGAAALLPLALCLFLIGLYNRARFDSWTEFGVRYQLAGSHVQKLDTFDARSILPGLYFYFLSPPILAPEFPFVSLAPRYPAALPPGYYGPEPIAGVLAHAPFLAVLLVGPGLLRRGPRDPGLRLPIATLAGVGVLSALVASFVFPSATMRYEVDFISFLLVPALLLWFRADEIAEGPLRRAARVLFAGAIAWAILLSSALSLTGYGGPQGGGAPRTGSRLQRFLEPLGAAAGRLFPHDARATVRMRIAFPERPAAEREPLLSSGPAEAPDLLFVEQVGPGRMVFGFQHGTEAERLAPAVRIRPGAFHDLEVDLDRSGKHVIVRLDGREVATFSGPLGPVRRDWIWPGRGPKGGDGAWGRFSGGIVTEFQLQASPPGLDALPEIGLLPAIHTETRASPPEPSRGQLWITSQGDGAYLFDGAAWRWISRTAFDRVRIDRRVVFDAFPREPEALVVSGDTARADVVCLVPAGGRRVAVGFDRWRGAWDHGPRSGPLTLEPGKPYALEVTLDRPAGLVVARIDGGEILRASADLAPLRRGDLRVGSAPAGLPGLGPFTGRILPD